MVRKYIGMHTFSESRYVLSRIKKAVQAENKEKVFPEIKYEIKKTGDFFYFLPADEQEKNLLALINTFLSRWNLPGVIISNLMTLNEVRSWVKPHKIGTIQTFELPELPEWQFDAVDPLDLSEVTFDPSDPKNTSFGYRFDQLRYWLSATAEGSWQTFKDVCAVLDLVDKAHAVRSIPRRLTLLGSIERSNDGRKWSINPTMLVQCAAGEDSYFLTGQQSPRLIDQLKENYDVETLPQWNYQGPSCVRLKGPFADNVALNGFNIVNAGNVSIKLAKLLPDLEEWKDILPVIDRLSTTTYNIERWNGTQYVQCDTFYERDGRYYGESGLYRLTKKAENNPYQIVLYLDKPKQRWLRGDWYGLRFLTYNSAGQQLEVKYDTRANELLIPIEGHLPLLYERSLVLASGMLPARDNNNTWLKYTNISNELVQLLAEKLNITIGEI